MARTVSSRREFRISKAPGILDGESVSSRGYLGGYKVGLASMWN
jgi:hypothetical protein